MFLALPMVFERRPDDCPVGDLFDETRRKLRLEVKQVAAICGVSGDTIEKAITGDRPLDLRWVQRMPWSFLAEFWCRFLYSRQKAFIAEMSASLKRRVS